MSTLDDSIHKELTDLDVTAEANRCLFCFDAPCTWACPTHIDVASFIKKIATGNLLGSARTIMDANPMGGSCARVCPTENLCEGACVYAKDSSPIRIGDLQRYATDWARGHNAVLFEAGPDTGRRVAIVGGGPAGLSAARELRRMGHGVTIFDANAELGGLNTYGIVPFRLSRDVALWEAQQVIDMGVTLRMRTIIGADVTAEQLSAEYDAVILACGMARVPKLGIPGEDLSGVLDALEFIERAKTEGAVAELGSDVVVIGAGNTAIDASTCSKRLGAPRVTMYYRRSEREINAYPFEYDFAKQEGVEFRWLCAPERILGENGRVRGVEFVRTALESVDGGVRKPPAKIAGSEFEVKADTVIRAIGQTRRVDLFEQLGIAHRGGVVQVDHDLETSHPGIFAAGDCTFAKGGRDAMVVEAAEQGKIAARSVDRHMVKQHG